jgi:hypothetical protein
VYLNRWVLLLSLIVGLAGVAATGRAFAEYRDAVRAYSQVEAVYVPRSFSWDDASTGSVTLRIVNRSPRAVTVEHLELRLYLDGQFAGADYDPWQPLRVERQSEVPVTRSLQVAISALQPVAATARIAIRGELRLQFDGIERPLTVRVRIDVGQAQSRTVLGTA